MRLDGMFNLNFCNGMDGYPIKSFGYKVFCPLIIKIINVDSVGRYGMMAITYSS